MTRTPMSDSAMERYPEFMDAIKKRLEAGRQSYGDASFTMPAERLYGEIGEEMLDIVGWTFVLWCRLRELEARSR